MRESMPIIQAEITDCYVTDDASDSSLKWVILGVADTSRQNELTPMSRRGWARKHAVASGILTAF